MKLPGSRDGLVSWMSSAGVCVDVCTVNWNKLIGGYSPGATTEDTPKALLELWQDGDLPVLFCVDMLGVLPRQAK